MLACIGSLADLIRHRFHVLRKALQQDSELTPNNTAIVTIGPGGVHEDAR